MALPCKDCSETSVRFATIPCSLTLTPNGIYNWNKLARILTIFIFVFRLPENQAPHSMEDTVEKEVGNATHTIYASDVVTLPATVTLNKCNTIEANIYILSQYKFLQLNIEILYNGENNFHKWDNLGLYCAIRRRKQGWWPDYFRDNYLFFIIKCSYHMFQNTYFVLQVK